MSTGTRRADGRAQIAPRPVEVLALILNAVLLVALTALVLGLLGITSPSAVAANATLIAFVVAGFAVVASLVAENIKEARTGAHSMTRRVFVSTSEPPRDILSEALAAIEDSEHRFRAAHPEIVMAPPKEAAAAALDETNYADLPTFARPVA